jgi:hypothetical protein
MMNYQKKLKSKIHLLLLTFLVLPTLLYSADQKTVAFREIKEVSKKTDPNSPANSQASAGQDTLSKLLSIPGVDKAYDGCKSEKLEKVPDCIWTALEGRPDLKTKVQQMYANENTPKTPDGASRAPASTTPSDLTNLTNKSKQIGEDYMSDPAVVNLSKIFEKKLEEALIGDASAQKDTKKIAAVDHAKFIELYRTELGKTIVNAFTSYCLETVNRRIDMSSKKDCKDKDNKPTDCIMYFLSDEDSKKQTVENNLKLLKDANLDLSTDTTSNPDANRWTGCIGSVSNVCYATDADLKLKSGSEDSKRSQTKACVIMDYVKSARKNLIIANQQEGFYANLASKDLSANIMENDRKVEINSKNSNDSVVTATSKDIEDAYKEASKKEYAEIEKCVDTSGKISNTESCKKYLNINKDDKEKDLVEFGLRQNALGEKINNLADKGTKEDVKKYLIEEGYKENVIADMIKNNEDLTKVKAEIKQRYINEKDAIIASMAEKIKAKTSSENGKIDNASTSDTSDTGKLNKIKEDLKTRTSDLENLVHFNNVVSSYLEIDSGKTKSRNVASLYDEINNGSEAYKKDNKDLRDKATKANLKEKTDSGDKGTDLSVENLNSIYKYSTEK